jgi:DNA polymerase III subunit delta
MILKSYEIKKINIQTNKGILLYGENQGLKDEIISNFFKKNFQGTIYNYEENEIIKNIENFYNTILTKSFFENEKLIVIHRATEKIRETVEEIIERNVEDLSLVINSNLLEKKSKLRNLFEKGKKLICIPCYEDNIQTLSGIASSFFKQKKIQISQQTINMIVERSRGDRRNLQNELNKIESFMINKSKISVDEIIKITNLAENYDASELVDQCLAKNKRKIINILNENNYSFEDSIIIIRTFLAKAKRLHKIFNEMKNNKNAESVIATIKPPIFWKDKELVKRQTEKWNYNSIEDLIFKINQTELNIKKNSLLAINILSNFIIEQSSLTNN